MAGVLIRERDIKRLGLTSKQREELKKMAEERHRDPLPPPPNGSISISEASRRYNIPQPTISRWVRKGFIIVIQDTGWAKYIGQEQMAELAANYARDPGRGKWTIKKVADENRNNNR